MKKKVNLLVIGVKELVWYLFQVSVLSIAVILGCKWFGDLLEPICDHINVGMGLFIIFAAVAIFIYIDNRNSVEEAQRGNKRNYSGEQQAIR